MILNYTVKDFMATKLITFLPQTPIEVAVGTFSQKIKFQVLPL